MISGLNYYNTGVTVELGELIESGFKLWDFDYPSYYKGSDKTAFEQLVTDHYRFRQIGQETPGRFKHYFKTKLREIMPYYIQLYESVDLMASVEDPFQAYDLTETFRKSTSDSGSSSSTQTGSSERSSEGDKNTERRYSETPQGSISNLESFLTNAEKTSEEESISDSASSSGSSSFESTGTGSEEYTLTRKGNIGVQPLGQELEAYRRALINVDLMIIEELNNLFLMVY